MSAEQIHKWTAILGEQWDVGNFLWKIRQGIFAEGEAAQFEIILKNIVLTNRDQQLSRAFVSVFWYVPLFLYWNRERVAKKSGHPEQFETFMLRVEDAISEILGSSNSSTSPHENHVFGELRREWQSGGFLERLSRGIFDEEGGRRFEQFLNSIDVSEQSQSIDRELVTGLWKVPLHLERLADSYSSIDSAHAQQISRYAAFVENALQGILGIP
jgi:hypothetical protein